MSATSILIGDRQLGTPATVTDTQVRQRLLFHTPDVYDVAAARIAVDGEVVPLDEVIATVEGEQVGG